MKRTSLLAWSNRASFSDLKTATGKDTNSLNVDPSFVDTDDLHVREITLNEAGTPLTPIEYDFDMEMRDTLKPDIGADEFDPPAPEDAGVVSYHGPTSPFAAGSHNVEVVLKNFGSDTLVSATINWTVHGITQTAHSWTGSLLPGKNIRSLVCAPSSCQLVSHPGRFLLRPFASEIREGFLGSLKSINDKVKS